MSSINRILRNRAAERAAAEFARAAGYAGLYAAGADMASIMAGHYPAGGINLGPAMTFGYIAGKHAATALGEGRD